MRTLTKIFLTTSMVGAPLIAGALRVEISDPAGNAEAVAMKAVLVARTTACHSPEKSVVTATAEGLVNGKRQSIPLKLTALSSPGTFAVTEQWPHRGAWVVKLVATNPDYKSYATGAIARVTGGSVDTKSVQNYFRAPAAQDVKAALEGGSLSAAGY